MMKRKLAMALAVSMVVGSLAACGGKTDQAATTAAPKAENAQGDVYKRQVTDCCWGRFSISGFINKSS